MTFFHILMDNMASHIDLHIYHCNTDKNFHPLAACMSYVFWIKNKTRLVSSLLCVLNHTALITRSNYTFIQLNEGCQSSWWINQQNYLITNCNWTDMTTALCQLAHVYPRHIFRPTDDLTALLTNTATSPVGLKIYRVKQETLLFTQN